MKRGPSRNDMCEEILARCTELPRYYSWALALDWYKLSTTAHSTYGLYCLLVVQEASTGSTPQGLEGKNRTQNAKEYSAQKPAWEL